jgi:hypothetical protein
MRKINTHGNGHIFRTLLVNTNSSSTEQGSRMVVTSGFTALFLQACSARDVSATVSMGKHPYEIWILEMDTLTTLHR